MASTKAKTIAVIGVVLFVGLITFLTIKVRAHLIQKRALAELKENNPVEYYVLHTPLTQKEDELKNEMVGTWQLMRAKSRSTGDLVWLQSPGNFLKTFSLTNWSIVTYDFNSNIIYSAGGHYTLEGERYSESIERATGQMTRYLGSHPSFRIRVVGNKYYQMGAGKNPSLEEMWQRVDQ